MSTGFMIVIEGVDHAGKTTQRELLAERLRKDGYDVVVTREPGGTPYAEKIRDLILFPGTEEPIYPETELLLFSAARLQHVRNVIIPAIQAGKVVICDRFVLSTFAYQVWPYVTEEDKEIMNLFYGLMPYVLGQCIQPVTFFLNLPVEEREARAKARGKENNHLDNRSPEFYEKVNYAFSLTRNDPTTMEIDANRPVDVIANELYETTVDYMKRYNEHVAQQNAAAEAEALQEEQANELAKEATACEAVQQQVTEAEEKREVTEALDSALSETRASADTQAVEQTA